MSATTLKGINGNIPGYDGVVSPYSTQPLLSFSFGALGQIMFHNQLLVQFDLLGGRIGTRLKYENGYNSQLVEDYHLHTRLLFGSKVYMLKSAGRRLIFVYGVGPFAGLNMGGSDGTRDEPFTSNDNFHMGKMDLHKVNLGLSVMMGIEFDSAQIAIHYDHGFRNLAPRGTMRTAGLYLSMSVILDI